MSALPDPVDTDDDPPLVDGRTARRERNRDLVLDAVLELFAEGALEPETAMVAERSGVSLRSMYRYFDSTDALMRAAIARNLEKVAPLFEIDGLGAGPLPERIERMVDGRFRLFEEIAPMMRATLQRAPANDLLRETLDQNLRAMRRQVDQMFAPELDRLEPSPRRETAGGLDILLGFQSFEHLRHTRGLSGGESRRVVHRAVAALLAQSPGASPPSEEDRR
jgi:AcrR family transcriptional regulator